ncbi:thiol:disulfide interchange protein DsbA [Providencia alcalifaciens]|nr:thiol:disulfide interchange protein DsbA [Providencia alcalifaciens]
MLTKLNSILASILMVFSIFSFAQPDKIRLGQQYQEVDKIIDNVPPVIEFFSFYCGPCYLFAETYHVDKTISDSLPDGVKLTKYHVGIMGALGEELTTAWSIAISLNLQNEAEKLLFERQKAKTLNSIDDIKSVFLELGISGVQYDEMKQRQDVNELIDKQNKAIKQLKVTSTPAFYILGKYKINNNGVNDKTFEGYPKGLADIIIYLLNK